MKTTRVDEENPCPYTGPSCKCAGVEPGKIYEHFDEAKDDAERLCEYNPTGFVVLVMKEGKNA